MKLRERFEEAVATLKQQRRSGHSLYDLPWYVIIGAPGSGKTTALLNSGLKFPLEQRVGKGALRGVGGTRNCDWWFTDEAVFLDTAGRYTTQDSDAASDSAGWKEFLALLRKYRKRRPVNGVILTISAQDLMTQGDAGREAHVEAARRRLNELNRELHIQLPVYLMVTKCDLVAGFTEYFDDLTQEGRAQVWGVTFPYEQTLERRGAAGVSGGVRRADGAAERAACSRGSRKSATCGAARTVFAFPQQMAALRDLLDAVRQRRLRLDARSTSRSCCAASTSPAARRTARRSIACSAPSAAGSASRRRPWRRRPGAARRTSSSGCSRT